MRAAGPAPLMRRITPEPPGSHNASSIRSSGEDQPLRVVLIGTDFEVRVWETLLRIPMGRATTLFRHRRPPRQPEGLARRRRRGRQEPGLIRGPCHRVLGKSGALTGYHWA